MQLIFFGLISCHLFSAWKIASSPEVLAVILFQIFFFHWELEIPGTTLIWKLKLSRCFVSFLNGGVGGQI